MRLAGRYSVVPDSFGLALPFVLVAAFVLPGCAWTQSPAARSGSGNLVDNPGFENAKGNLPAGWIVQNLGNGDISVDASVHASGTRSLRLTPNRRNTHPDRPLGMGQQFRIPGLEGKRVRIQASLRVSGGAAANVLVFAVGGSGAFLATAHLQQSGATAEFVTKTDSLVIGQGAASLIVGCGVTGTSGSAWFDDVLVAADDAGAAPVPRETAQSTRLSAYLSIDARQPVRTIPRTLFGANMEWIYNGHGIVDAGAGRLDAERVGAVRDLRLGLIRFPGGVLADYYHWSDGVGPIASRPVLPYVVDPNRARNTFGTDELMELCRATGAVPLLQTNLITGTAAEAAGWVAYCNRPDDARRIRNGHPEPYRVRFWELGNEQYMQHPNAETARSQISASEYATRVRSFSAAMKREDPSILVGAVTGQNFGNYKIVQDEGWNRTVLQQTASAIDFVALHNAYAPVVLDQKNVSFEQVYQALLAFPVLLSDHLKAVNREIDQYAAGDRARLKIAITEWGPLFAFAPTSPWVGHTKTLGAALFAASVLQTLMAADRVELAAFFQLLSQNNFSGWLGPHGEPKATYYAVQMYTQHFGDTLVGTSVESPGYSSSAAGVVAAVPKVPYLDAIASLSFDGSKLYLVVINKHFRAAVSAGIALRGFMPRASGRSWVLTAPSLDANNGDDRPAAAGARWGRQNQAPGHSMFESGLPGTVAIRPGPAVTATAEGFQYEFSPMSVTSIELAKR